MCGPPPQTLACSPDSVQPASARVWGYSFCNSTMPLIPSGFHIYICISTCMLTHIYIFLSLTSGAEQLVKGKLSLGPLVPGASGAVGLVCAVPWLLSLAPLPRILQCALSPKVSEDTAHSRYSSMYAVYVKGRWGLPIAHSCLFRSRSLTSCMRVQRHGLPSGSLVSFCGCNSSCELRAMLCVRGKHHS